MATTAWKLDSGWPLRIWTPTTAANPAPESRSGLRTNRSVMSSSHGIHDHALMCG